MKPRRLTKENINSDVKDKSGIYTIYCYKGNKPLVIGRLLKKDNKGILSIGQSIHLNQRLKDFIRGTKTAMGHSSGNRYEYFLLKNKLGRHKLMFTFKYCRRHKYEEGKSQMDYVVKYGELPPLNGKEPTLDILRELDFAE